MTAMLTPPSVVIVADNVGEWGDLIAGVVKDECFPASAIEFRLARDAIGARKEIDRARSEGIEPGVVTDLHMDPTGDRPELNGDRLIASLADGRLPPFAVVSGT